MHIHITLKDIHPDHLQLVADFVEQMKKLEVGTAVQKPQEQAPDELTALLGKLHPLTKTIMEERAGKVDQWSHQQVAWLLEKLKAGPAGEFDDVKHKFMDRMCDAEWSKSSQQAILWEEVVDGKIPCHPWLIHGILCWIYPETEQ